ncbi:ADP-ribose pyrophosphatase [Candidatus Marinamargulisbacteria bacterium SCGC AG-439-L15]|nr:ADP-ribose pyrophosphatase [Candidatus Marinamargulisbacteria bacterium SCGC AG-439-L15]
MAYCIKCGSQTDWLIPELDTHPRDVCTRCDYIHYVNPSPIVGVLPIYKGKVLLCKRNIEPKKNFWTLPAGFMEVNESIEEGALRELDEEAGVSAKIVFLQSVFSMTYVNQVYMMFLGQLDSDRCNPGEETLEARFFLKEEVPWDELAFKPVTFSLKAYFKDPDSRETVVGSDYLYPQM